MNAISSDIVEAAPSKPVKPLITKVDIGVYIALILLEAAAAFAWYESHASPYNQSWSDPANRACGRTMSADGRFLWQRCDIKRYRAISTNQTPPLNLQAGSNANGERFLISCGPAQVALTMPEASRSFGFEKAMSGFANGNVDYTFEWTEGMLKYSFLMKAIGVIFFLCLLEPAFRWGARRLALRPNRSAS